MTTSSFSLTFGFDNRHPDTHQPDNEGRDSPSTLTEEERNDILSFVMTLPKEDLDNKTHVIRVGDSLYVMTTRLTNKIVNIFVTRYDITDNVKDPLTRTASDILSFVI